MYYSISKLENYIIYDQSKDLFVVILYVLGIKRKSIPTAAADEPFFRIIAIRASHFG